MSFTQEQLDAATAAARNEAEGRAAAEFAASQAELARLRSERQAERIAAQIAGWTAAGVVTPAQMEGLAEFLASIEVGGGEFSFSAADKSALKKTPAQFFADFVAKRGPVVRLGNSLEQAGNQDAALDVNDANQIARRARQYAKEQADRGVTVSLPEAVAYIASHAA